jgi:hypothetical protein
MKKSMFIAGSVMVVMACLMAVWPNPARAQGGFEQVSGDPFNHAIPTDFYLEGEHVPVQKRNAVLLKTNKGARVVVGLIDTTGYSSQFQQKYVGMLISEAKISVCGHAIGVGSYGFGLDRPPAPSNADAKFILYDQAGGKVGECAVKKDDSVKQAKPLSVTTATGAPAKLWLGKYAVEIK